MVRDSAAQNSRWIFKSASSRFSI